jgi:PIN domain nuclease of toxin-antitoxin system
MTALLLDTNVWLRWTAGEGRISKRARAAILASENRILFSVASAWEIAIKYGTGRLSLPAPPSTFVPQQIAQQGFEVLPILIRHATAVADLPSHHRDPFDRLLIAQASVDGLTLVTSDATLLTYDVSIIKA